MQAQNCNKPTCSSSFNNLNPAEGFIAGTGHFHVLIDQPAPSEGEAIPFDDAHKHYGKGQTADDVALTPVSGLQTEQHRSYRLTCDHHFIYDDRQKMTGTYRESIRSHSSLPTPATRAMAPSIHPQSMSLSSSHALVFRIQLVMNHPKIKSTRQVALGRT
jgi:hypothetical protein